MSTTTAVSARWIEEASVEELEGMEIPSSFKAAYVEKEDAVRLWEQPEETRNRADVRETLKVGEIPMPELAPDEVLVAIMSAALNYNTVWSARFEPIPGFLFLDFLGKTGGWNKRHDQDYQVLGSDASGIIVRTGEYVKRWNVGDRVVIAPGWGDLEEGVNHHDMVKSQETRAWGFETNYGGLAYYTVVKSAQLMPKPKHLTWEEAACNTLCAMTSYRMLVGEYGATIKQGDLVFVWGAAGGLGAYAIQMIKNGGGVAIGVVNSERKQRLLEELDCDLIIRRDQMDLEGLEPRKFGKAFREIVRAKFGEDPHVIFEHVGEKTFWASVYLARNGGKIVTCGSSTGADHHYDNRYLWMKTKRIIGSHGATLQEAKESNRLIEMGRIQPALSKVAALDDVAQATHELDLNQHVGKVGILCLAEEEGLGIEDPEFRAQIGEDKVALFRKYA
jgi:crotonyl-CoA reductase